MEESAFRYLVSAKSIKRTTDDRHYVSSEDIEKVLQSEDIELVDLIVEEECEIAEEVTYAAHIPARFYSWESYLVLLIKQVALWSLQKNWSQYRRTLGTQPIESLHIRIGSRPQKVNNHFQNL